METEAPALSLETLANKFAFAEPPPFALTTEIWGEHWRPKQWGFAGAVLYGPGGWALRPENRTVNIHHIIKHGYLTTKTKEGAAVIAALNFLGDFFNSSTAIISHEMVTVPDLPLTESAQKLSQEFEQADTWQEMLSAYFTDGCWMMASLPIDENATMG